MQSLTLEDCYHIYLLKGENWSVYLKVYFSLKTKRVFILESLWNIYYIIWYYLILYDMIYYIILQRCSLICRPIFILKDSTGSCTFVGFLCRRIVIGRGGAKGVRLTYWFFMWANRRVVEIKSLTCQWCTKVKAVSDHFPPCRLLFSGK